MLNLRHAHGAERKLLQVRQLRWHQRLLLKELVAAAAMVKLEQLVILKGRPGLCGSGNK